MAAERFFIATTNADDELAVRTCGGIELGDELSDWPISQTMLNRVLQSGRALLVANAARDREFASVKSVHEHDLLSVMCVPLGQDPCLGVAYVDNQSRQGAFSRQDLVFLAMLGHFVFIALRNAIELDRAALDKQLGEAKFIEIQQALLRESEIVGESPRLLSAFNTLQRGAMSDATLLLLGEMGTGKEVFARAAHRLSARAAGPFVARNCAAIPAELLESELLGYEAGAFTSAHKQKHGAFDLAKGGTLFLDEIGELPLELQPKLLRVLETGEYTRLGGTETHRSDVRMVFATNANLEAAVQEGRFRPDLFFRINTLDVNIPPLRKRAADIPLLCEHFFETYGQDEAVHRRCVCRVISL